MTVAPPQGLLAELTHRCPLRCPYCSNPVDLARRSDELDTETWKRVFSEAQALGVLQLHLSGGEPTARSDLVPLVAYCARMGLYTNLITSGVLLAASGLADLRDAGLDHIQLSLQDNDAETADEVAGLAGSHRRKIALAQEIVRLGLPLTVNLVVHRRNTHSIDRMVMLALDLGARRIEIAHAQYHGWALRNRQALMPTAGQVAAAQATVTSLKERLADRIVIDFVTADHYARFPKTCMGGWGARALNVTPSGRVLPCHAAETIPGLRLPTVRDSGLADIWFKSDVFNRYRELDWMLEPCRSCERRDGCRGGCRCQALAFTGRAENADPACMKSEFHDAFRTCAVEAAAAGHDFEYRHFADESRPGA